MRDIDPSVQAAMQARAVMPCDLLSVWPKDRESGAEVEFGFWPWPHAATLAVIDPITRATVDRLFQPNGLISIGPIRYTADLTVREVEGRMSPLDAAAIDAIRTYDLRNARVELHTGWLSPTTGLLIDAAVPDFVGWVDRATITTPREGEEGALDVTLVSHSRLLTRPSGLLRSHEALTARAAGDTFRKDAASVGSWQIFWGRDKQALGQPAGTS